jgi:hypothetical protein
MTGDQPDWSEWYSITQIGRRLLDALRSWRVSSSCFPKRSRTLTAPALLYPRPLGLQTYACRTDIQTHLHPRYDTDAASSLPHSLFAFRVFNHTNSNVSNCGLPVWECTLQPQLLSQLGVLLPLDERVTRGVSPPVSTSYVQRNDSSSMLRTDGVGRFQFNLVLNARARGGHRVFSSFVRS